ncbi:hypothetical protein D3C76_562740 [compost metagenome]
MGHRPALLCPQVFDHHPAIGLANDHEAGGRPFDHRMAEGLALQQACLCLLRRSDDASLIAPVQPAQSQDQYQRGSQQA